MILLLFVHYTRHMYSPCIVSRCYYQRPATKFRSHNRHCAQSCLHLDKSSPWELRNLLVTLHAILVKNDPLCKVSIPCCNVFVLILSLLANNLVFDAIFKSRQCLRAVNSSTIHCKLTTLIFKHNECKKM